MVEFDRQDLAAASSAAGGAADRFAELALELHNAPTVADTVEAVVQFAVRALGCTYAGVALAARGGQAEIAAATDPLVAEVFQLQIDTGNGPLITALHEQTTLLISDTATEDRWPDWTGKVAGLGVRSVLAVPLATTSISTVGVLSLYHTMPDAFTADDEAIADIVARHASVAVASARHDESMARAVDARKLVGQAMGILMERFDIDTDQAFAVLRRLLKDRLLRPIPP